MSIEEELREERRTGRMCWGLCAGGANQEPSEEVVLV